MSQSKECPRVEESELLVALSRSKIQSNDTNLAREPSLGVPCPSRRIWLSDIALALINITCFAFAPATVFLPQLAIRLGQVNQLIMLGFPLQIMAAYTQKHVQYFLLAAKCLWNESSPQNFDSILQSNFVASSCLILLKSAISPISRASTGPWSSL